MMFAGKTIVNTIARRAAALEDNLFGLLTASSQRAYGCCFRMLLFVVMVTSILMFLTGAALQRNVAWGSLSILDGGWRLAQGLRSHSDYFDMFGVTSFMPALFGIRIAGCGSEALAYGPAILLPFMTIWAWTVARCRFPAVPSLVVVAFIGGLIVGAFPPGYLGWLTLGYQMQYNRFHWSLACLLALILFVEPRHKLSSLASACEGIGAGTLIGLLLAGKISYAVFAAMFLIASLAIGRSEKGRSLFWRATIATLFAMIALYLFYVRGDLRSYGNDLSLVFGVQHPGERYNRLALVLTASWREFLVPCSIALIYLRRIFASDQPAELVRARLKCFVAAAFLTAVGILLATTNCQFYDIPLRALVSMILAEVLSRPAESRANPGNWRPTGARKHIACALVSVIAPRQSFCWAFALWTMAASRMRLSGNRLEQPPCRTMQSSPAPH